MIVSLGSLARQCKTDRHFFFWFTQIKSKSEEKCSVIIVVAHGTIVNLNHHPVAALQGHLFTLSHSPHPIPSTHSDPLIPKEAFR